MEGLDNVIMDYDKEIISSVSSDMNLIEDDPLSSTLGQTTEPAVNLGESEAPNVGPSSHPAPSLAVPALIDANTERALNDENPPLPTVGMSPPKLEHRDESKSLRQFQWRREVSPEFDLSYLDASHAASPDRSVQAPPGDSSPSPPPGDSSPSLPPGDSSPSLPLPSTGSAPRATTTPVTPPPPEPSTCRVTTPPKMSPSISVEQVNADKLTDEGASTRDRAVTSPVLAPSGDVSTSCPMREAMPHSSDWPKHVVDAYRYLTGSGLTKEGDVMKTLWRDEWLACLQSFVKFQEQSGFPDLGPSFPPSTDVRPTEIAVWMKNGRHWKDVTIADIEKFRQRWWVWWHSLQPESRVCDKDSLTLIPATPDSDWSSLSKPGKNGFLLIMVSLMWWGKGSNQDGLWMHAVREVTAVLACLNDLVNINPPANAARSKRGNQGDADKAVVGRKASKRRKY